jgi:hypothetical protein
MTGRFVANSATPESVSDWMPGQVILALRFATLSSLQLVGEALVVSSDPWRGAYDFARKGLSAQPASKAFPTNPNAREFEVR